MANKNTTSASLRSAHWFAPDDVRSSGHRSRMMQMGYAPTEWTGRPVIAILHTWSDINSCHTHLKLRADVVKRGILQAEPITASIGRKTAHLIDPHRRPMTVRLIQQQNHLFR
jgi:dihydroxyacid dehydratase/phosphogluconate dehydratase